MHGLSRRAPGEAEEEEEEDELFCKDEFIWNEGAKRWRRHKHKDTTWPPDMGHRAPLWQALLSRVARLAAGGALRRGASGMGNT